MDLEFSEEQEELRRSVQSFLVRECPIELVREVVETGKGAERLLGAMTALDWPALAIPEAFGGLGLSFADVAVVVEELGAVIAPGPYLATVTQFAPCIVEAGSVEQQQHYLGAVASGSLTGSLALADHPLRWRIEDVKTQAEKVGDRWVLNGQKQLVLAQSDVDEIVIVARVTGGGIGLFVVPASSLSLDPIRSLDASRQLVRLTLNDVSVSDDRVLGDPGSPDTEAALTRVIQLSAVALALEVLGCTQRFMDMTLQYAKDREQFGATIGSFQSIKHKMANSYVSLQRARSLVYFAVAAITEDDPRRGSAASMAKAAADDCQLIVCKEGIQTFGGIAYTWEHDAHLYMKRARTAAALFGSAGEHRMDIARGLGVGVR